MKIGTITFHWATNYGAVLQAYALQEYLKQKNYHTEIINYIPIRVRLIQILNNVRKMKVSEFVKERKIRKFRKEWFELSRTTYFTNKQLYKKCHDYDIYICGSDQIWNESFTMGAEGKPTLVYYLNFVANNKKRISYAASFGTDALPVEMIYLVKPELEKYAAISTREITGNKIVMNMGLNSTLVVDPTLLIDKNAYEKLFVKKKIKKQYQLFTYKLHENTKTLDVINDYVYHNYFSKNTEKNNSQQPIGIYEWLFHIKNAKLVITNSFHGVVFSIIFHTPFLVVPVEGSKMNDRITTLLSSVGLTNRFLDRFDQNKIDQLMVEEIGWDEVEEKITILRMDSEKFLDEAVKYTKKD